MQRRAAIAGAALFACTYGGGGDLRAEDSPLPAPIEIRRASGAIAIDGDLSDQGWHDATRVDTWYETNPGDNVPPRVTNVGYLAYDERFFYAGFEFSDPAPTKIRAPFGDRDNVEGSTDYGGVILDTSHDRKTAILFLANPRGIQYDAVTSDVGGGEDSSPDYYWDSAARITEHGWNLELRIPFSSLRYARADPQTWGIMLYRNYPREFRYQMFSTRLPRGGNCFICRENALVGLSGLPAAGNWILAPYVTAGRESVPANGPGTPLESRSIDGSGGLDVKWTPNAVTALDLTINPDFSQIESDVAQIATNQRFALFFPEKRPFFLEGIELFSTPLQAVYTRTITDPRWGARVTGRRGKTAYTALVGEDAGGGSVILPGSSASALAEQDFSSRVGIARLRHDIGRSFVSLLGSAREIDTGGYNRVFGPDFQYRPTERDTLSGQFLLSRSRTPDRPDLAAEWDGRELSSHASDLWWSHNTSHRDLFLQYRDIGEDFRADNGFLPQVGIREAFGETGYTFRPQGPVSRIRTFAFGDRTEDRDGNVVFRGLSTGVGLDARWNSFLRLRYAFDDIRAGNEVLSRHQFVYTIQASPSLFVAGLLLDGALGEEIDFANSRPGHGGRVTLRGTLRPTVHLELAAQAERRWVDVRPSNGGSERRLFTADVSRLRATYSFNARSYLRLIGQYTGVRRDPTLYGFPVGREDGELNSSVLFAYKLNWQSVLFVGYGDDRTLVDAESLEPAERQLFLKASYAFQR